MSSDEPPPLDPVTAAAQAAHNAAAAAAFDQFTIEVWILLTIGLLVTMLRTYARSRTTGLKGLGAEDYLAWLGALLYAVETALAYGIGHFANGLANNGMTEEHRALLGLYPKSTEYRMRVIGCRFELSGWTIYSCLLWTLKASLMTFFTRLTSGLDSAYRLRIRIGFGFLLLSWIVVICNLFLSCRPFNKYWQIFPDPGNICQPALSDRIVWVTFAFNAATDIYIMFIPLPLLWQSSMSAAKKVGLTILFSGGLLVIACAVLRCIFIVIDPVDGAQLAGTWAVRETFIAMIVSNLPMIFPLMKNAFIYVVGPLMTTTSYTETSGAPKPKHPRTVGGGGSSSWSWRRPRRAATPNPITSMMYNESEEQMINGHKLQSFPSRSELSGDMNKSIRKQTEVIITREDRK